MKFGSISVSGAVGHSHWRSSWHSCDKLFDEISLKVMLEPDDVDINRPYSPPNEANLAHFQEMVLFTTLPLTTHSSWGSRWRLTLFVLLHRCYRSCRWEGSSKLALPDRK
jgi:hypothetical protein